MNQSFVIPQIDLRVEAICEACGHPYTTATHLYARRSLLAELWMVPAAAKALERQMARLALTLYNSHHDHMPATRTLTPAIVPPEDWPWRE